MLAIFCWAFIGRGLRTILDGWSLAVLRTAVDGRSAAGPTHCTETRCRSTQGLTTYSILSLEPECLKNPISISRVDPRGWNELFVRDAQAACVFRCSASKCAPFFQMIRVIAAILRASVSRAIEGLIPLASNAW